MTPNGRWTLRRGTEESQVVPGPIMGPPPLHDRKMRKAGTSCETIEPATELDLGNDGTLVEELMGIREGKYPETIRPALAESEQPLTSISDELKVPSKAEGPPDETNPNAEFQGLDSDGDQPESTEREAQTRHSAGSLFEISGEAEGSRCEPSCKDLDTEEDEAWRTSGDVPILNGDVSETSLELPPVEDKFKSCEPDLENSINEKVATSTTGELGLGQCTTSSIYLDFAEASATDREDEDDTIIIQPFRESLELAEQVNGSSSPDPVQHINKNQPPSKPPLPSDVLSNEVVPAAQQGPSWYPGKPGPKSSKSKRRVTSDAESHGSASEHKTSIKGGRPKKRARRLTSARMSFASSNVESALSSTLINSDNIQPSPASGSALSTTRKSGRRRSSARKKSHTTSDVEPPAIMFSSTTKIQEKKTVMRAFRALGGEVATSIKDATMLCVPDDGLKKTPKFLMAILRGLDIVTEAWLVAAHRDDKFPNPHIYFPKDPKKEKEWRFNLADTVQRDTQSMVNLLSPYTVYLSEQFKAEMHSKGSLKDYTEIAMMLGARNIKTGHPADGADVANVVLIGTSDDVYLVDAQTKGFKMYTQDLIPMAVLRGTLDLDSDEFRVEIPVKDEPED